MFYSKTEVYGQLFGSATRGWRNILGYLFTSAASDLYGPENGQ